MLRLRWTARRGRDMMPLEGDFLDLLTNYTFRTMILGTGIVGAVAGLLGCLLYLRKQTMISDVIGHSAIGGVALGFIVCTTLLGVNGRSMLALTISAAVTTAVAVLVTNLITRWSRLGTDAAMAVTLALFFGGGMVLMRWIVHSTLPERGGIEKYMFGNASTLNNEDLVTIAIIAALIVAIVVALFKEFMLFAFDPVQATMLGFSPRVLQPVMLVTITTGIVIGIKAVGLILMIGFVMLPAVAARQWARRLPSMALISTAIGGVGGIVGSVVSVQLGRVPTGPVIIMVLFAVFVVSLLVAPGRSLLAQVLGRRRLAGQEVAS